LQNANHTPVTSAYPKTQRGCRPHVTRMQPTRAHTRRLAHRARRRRLMETRRRSLESVSDAYSRLLQVAAPSAHSTAATPQRSPSPLETSAAADPLHPLHSIDSTSPSRQRAPCALAESLYMQRAAPCSALSALPQACGRRTPAAPCLRERGGRGGVRERDGERERETPAATRED
jgi:hypothetical protein